MINLLVMDHTELEFTQGQDWKQYFYLEVWQFVRNSAKILFMGERLK